jgi:hypothetical protein
LSSELHEKITNILFEEIGKIKVHIIDPNSSILEIDYELIADRIINETKKLL